MKTTVARYEMKIKIPSFECEAGIERYMGDIFTGEYDLDLNINAPRILDIGANQGAFSIWAVRRFPGAHVYAYEPNSNIFHILKRNTEINAGSAVTIYNHGIGEPGVRKFYQGINNCGEGSLYGGSPEGSMDVVIESPMSLPEADIIKMDTEGCEVEILNPLIKSGRKFDAILFEYHRHDDRCILENLLAKDYKLVGAKIFGPHRGVMKYVHEEYFR